MTGPVLPEGLDAALARAGLGPVRLLGSAPGSARWVTHGSDGIRWVVTVVGPVSARRAADVRDRLRRLSMIDHPHLARVGPLLELGRGGLAVLHQEVPGTDLATVRAGRGPWAAGEVVTVVVPLAEALAALHAAGLAHGDVAAANVVLAPDGRAVLVDLACGDDPDERGTPGVAAPERSRGARPAGDVHALARLGLQLLARPAGRAPQDDDLPPSDDLDDAGRARLVASLTAATALDPDDRPDAAGLAAAVYATCRPVPVDLPDPAVLARLAVRRAAVGPGDDLTQRVPPRPARGARGRHRRRGRRGLVTAGGAALVIATCAVVVVLAGVDPTATGGSDGPGRTTDPVAAAMRLTVDRAEALVDQDVASLAAVTVPGSPARAADLTTLRRLRAAGVPGGPERLEVGSVALLPVGRQDVGRGVGHALGCARVRVVVHVTTGSVVGGPPAGTGADQADQAGVVLVLRRARDGWRVSEVSATRSSDP